MLLPDMREKVLVRPLRLRVFAPSLFNSTAGLRTIRLRPLQTVEATLGENCPRHPACATRRTTTPGRWILVVSYNALEVLPVSRTWPFPATRMVQEMHRNRFGPERRGHTSGRTGFLRTARDPKLCQSQYSDWKLSTPHDLSWTYEADEIPQPFETHLHPLQTLS